VSELSAVTAWFALIVALSWSPHGCTSTDLDCGGVYVERWTSQAVECDSGGKVVRVDEKTLRCVCGKGAK